MAERRMFAKTIIDSDAFLDMPMSAQALYFHLSMRADDEGFVNNPKKIQRMIGASEDDARLLIAKRFIIAFESGVIVIKHWRIHNYIRADRLVETKYKEERQQLLLKDNGAYSLNSELKEIEQLDSGDVRKIAYKNSSLPYSFTYKIKRAFEGQRCPICNCKMTSSSKLGMPTIQHNIPISKGGLHEIENISVICEHCNTSIRDDETDALNNTDVIEIWDRINLFESQKINWFDTPEILWNYDVSQTSVKCQSNDGIGKVRLGKDSIGKVNKNKRFARPSVEEVSQYCKEANLNVNAQQFVDYYESNGWKVGKNAMKDWKATCRNWARREQKDNGKLKRKPSFDIDEIAKKAKLNEDYEL